MIIFFKFVNTIIKILFLSFQANEIQVSFGSSPSIVLDEKISFNPNVLRGNNCSGVPFSNIFTFGVKAPTPELPPSVILQYPSSDVSLCEPFDIYILKVSNDGQRGIKEITWTALKVINSTHTVAVPQLAPVLEAANLRSSSYLTVGRLALEEFTEYQFKVQFKNFIGTIGIQEFRITSGSFSGIKLTSNKAESLTFKMYFEYEILISAIYSECLANGTHQEFPREMALTFEYLDSQSLPNTRTLTKSQSKTTVGYKIEKFQLEGDRTYDIAVRAELSANPLISSAITIKVAVAKSELLALIDGGSR